MLDRRGMRLGAVLLALVAASEPAVAATCGDGVLEDQEFCDHGAANGTAASCCGSDCLPRPYGEACADDGDLCTQDVCGNGGDCRHEMAPDPTCAVPIAARGGGLKIRAGAGGAARIQLKWRRGPAIAPETLAGLDGLPNRVCVYDQRAGAYELVHQASTTGGAGVWSPYGLGWRFADRTATDGGVEKLTIKQSSVPLQSRVDLRSRDAGLAALLPFEQRRRVVVQLHAGTGCWGASFATADRNAATRFAARSAAATLRDANGNAVREWMMVGDSNTNFLPCAYPSQLALRHPDVVVTNEGIFGSAAWGWIRDGLLGPLLETHQPDAVLIALGTNDLQTRAAGQIVADLQVLYAQVVAHALPNGAHPLAYVATVPPVYLQGGVHDAKIQAVNAAIRDWLPPSSVVDFDTWMPDEWDADVMWWPGDGVHVGCQGHARRADVLDEITGN